MVDGTWSEHRTVNAKQPDKRASGQLGRVRFQSAVGATSITVYRPLPTYNFAHAMGWRYSLASLSAQATNAATRPLSDLSACRLPAACRYSFKSTGTMLCSAQYAR